jgi:predicted RNA methylase
MSKLSKSQIRLHNEAEQRLKKDRLTDIDREFIYLHWHPGTVSNTAAASAFFTPVNLAFDFEFDAPTHGRILDACAGIGVLSWAISTRAHYRNPENRPDITAIERNYAYIEIGRKLLPWVNWIHADIFELPDLELGHFNSVIANPPFGGMNKPSRKFRYTGSAFELALIDMLSDHADMGAFIIPQMSAPFEFSGVQMHRRRHTRESEKFEKQTGLYLSEGIGIDCDYHRADWLEVAPRVEVVTVDFAEHRRKPPAKNTQFALAI